MYGYVVKRVVEVLLITVLCACGAMLPPKDKTSNKGMDNKGTDNQWVGHTVDELIVTIGEPSNVYMLDGGIRVFEYLQPNKTKASIQPSLPAEDTSLLSAEEERVRWIHAKRKNFASDQYQNCKTLKILFNVSASDIIESWSTKGGECK